MLYVYNTQQWIFVNKSTCFFNEDSSNKFVKGKQFSFANRNFTRKKSSLEKRVFNKMFWVTLMKSVFNIYKWMDQHLMILEW